MNSDDFFKDFFGFPGRRRGGSGFFFEDKHHDDFFNDLGEHFTPHGELEDDHSHRTFGEDFRIPEPFGMFRHFEEILKNFGMMDFPPGDRGLPSPGRKPAVTPRDRMLKEPDSQQPWNHPESRTQPKIDTDLDTQVEEGSLHSILAEPETSRRPDSFFRMRSSNSVIVTVKGSNGKLEKRTTVHDSNGGEETTITRSIGDQSHTVVSKQDPTGVKERIESFKNMDEKELHEFEKSWSSSGEKLGSLPNISPNTTPATEPSHRKGIMQRLYEYGFPGFLKPQK